MTKKSQLFLTAALSLALVAGPSFAASGVSVNEAGGVLNFAPAKAYGTATLVVSGPDGYHQTRTFTGGEAVSLSMIDGFDVADGSYTWSLTVNSPMSDELRAQVADARANGDEGFTARLMSSGDFYSETFTGSFARSGGVLIVPGATETLASRTDVPTKDNVILDDLIVDGSACIGVDCANGENFGFDTLRLKENNLRIKFEDTSSSASFPGVDWQLVANESSNGGLNKFSIEDVTNGKTAFTIEANAQANTLYVEDDGDVGIKTNNPVVDIHVVEGNSPTLRLEQDGSDGFASHTWDLAGNEANFFLRDVTNGSSLPLRVIPGAQGDTNNTLMLGSNGHVGVNSSDQTPDAQLDVTSEDNLVMRLTSSGNRAQMELENTTAAQTWRYDVNGAGAFTIIDANASVNALQIAPSTGNVTVAGTLTATVGGANLMFPDYVFEEDYDLMPLDELAAYIEAEGHLPKIEKADSVEARGNIDMTKLQLQLLEKIEELTLYTLAQQETIENLQQRIDALD